MPRCRPIPSWALIALFAAACSTASPPAPSPTPPPADPEAPSPHAPIRAAELALSVVRDPIPVEVQGAVSASSASDQTAGSAASTDTSVVGGVDGAGDVRPAGVGRDSDATGPATAQQVGGAVNGDTSQGFEFLNVDNDGRPAVDVQRIAGEVVPGNFVHTQGQALANGSEGVAILGKGAGVAKFLEFGVHGTDAGTTPGGVVIVGQRESDDKAAVPQFSDDYYLLTRAACRIDGTPDVSKTTVAVDRNTFAVTLGGGGGPYRRCIFAASADIGIRIDQTSDESFPMKASLGSAILDTCTIERTSLAAAYADTDSADGFAAADVWAWCWE